MSLGEKVSAVEQGEWGNGGRRNQEQCSMVKAAHQDTQLVSRAHLSGVRIMDLFSSCLALLQLSMLCAMILQCSVSWSSYGFHVTICHLLLATIT